MCVIVTAWLDAKAGRSIVSKVGCVAVIGKAAVGVSVGIVVGVLVGDCGVLLGAGVFEGMVVITMVGVSVSGTVAVSL